MERRNARSFRNVTDRDGLMRVTEDAEISSQKKCQQSRRQKTSQPMGGLQKVDRELPQRPVLGEKRRVAPSIGQHRLNIFNTKWGHLYDNWLAIRSSRERELCDRWETKPNSEKDGEASINQTLSRNDRFKEARSLLNHIYRILSSLAFYWPRRWCFSVIYDFIGSRFWFRCLNKIVAWKNHRRGFSE